MAPDFTIRAPLLLRGACAREVLKALEGRQPELTELTRFSNLGLAGPLRVRQGMRKIVSSSPEYKLMILLRDLVGAPGLEPGTR